MKYKVSEARTHKFGGHPPSGYSSWPEFAKQIPVYEAVDKDLLYQDDPRPFHIALDIAVLNAVSANGLLYDEPLISAMETQLLGLGGLRGHLGEAEYSAYPIEAVDWVGHVRVGDTIYAKGYIAPGDHRESVRRIIARGGKLRTSLDAQGYQEWVDKKKGIYRLREIDFFSIDIVHSGKAALKNYQSGQATITRETERQEKDMLNAEQELPNGAPVTTVHLAVEGQSAAVLRDEFTSLKTERETIAKELEDTKKQLTEARRYAAVVGSIRVNLGYGDDVSDEQLAPKVTEMYNVLNRLAEMLGNDASIEVAVSELLTYKQEATQREADQRLNTIVKSFTGGWNVHSEENKTKVTKLEKQLRRAITSETAAAGETLEAVAARVWKEDFQAMADSLVQAMGGPAAVVSSSTQSETKAELTEVELKNSRRFLPGK